MLIAASPRGTWVRALREWGAKRHCAFSAIVNWIRLRQADGCTGRERGTYCPFNLPQL